MKATKTKKRKKANKKAKRNLNAIKNIQTFMQDFTIAGEMSDINHTMLFRKSIPVTKTKQYQMLSTIYAFSGQCLLEC